MHASSRRAVTPSLMLAAALALSACVSVTDNAAQNPYPSPPPNPTEVIPKPPVSEAPLVWQPGHWDYTGSGYVYQSGKWVLREGHGTLWQDGYWAATNGTLAWIPAHWL